MFVVRYVALLALVIWVGGLIVLDLLVAPATIRALAAAPAPVSPALGGAVAAEVLQAFHLVAYACGAVITLALVIIKFAGPPPRAFFLRLGIVLVMLAVAVYSGVPLARAIARAEAAVAAAPGAAASAEPRARLARLHVTSATLTTIDTVLGLALLSWYVRE